MAEKILNDIPSNGWIHSNQKNILSSVSKLSSIVWEANSGKYYLETEFIKFNEPKPNYFPREKVEKISIIRLEYFSNKNAWFNKVENLQKQEHYIYDN